MMIDPASPQMIEAFRRFLKLFPHGADRTLVILKGHLLIEEQVRRIIDERVRKSDAIPHQDLECHMAICLAEALVGEESHEGLWKFVKKLNRIRNRIAHNIEPKGVDDMISGFVSGYPLENTGRDESIDFEFCLWSLYVWVSEYVRAPSAQVYSLVRDKPEA